MFAISPRTPSRYLHAALIVLSALAVYASSFSSPFIFDGVDLEKGLRNLADLPVGEWLMIRPRSFGYFTFDLGYTLHGRRVFWFHAGNVLVHVAAALLLYEIVRLTLAGKGLRRGFFPEDQAATVALVAAALFAVHPLQTQSVTYLYQRFESLMGMLFLAATFCFIRAQQARRPLAWYAASVAFFWLSIASKEVAVVFPLVILWFDRVFVASSWRELVARRWPYHLVTLGTLAAGATFVLLWLDHYRHGGLLRDDLISPLVYARHQAVAILRYLRLAVLPVGQCLDYAWRPTRTALETLPHCVAVVALLALTAWLAIRRPPLGFLAGTFFLILAPTSSFAPIVDLIFEHRMYLPLGPLCVLGALGWWKGCRWLRRRADPGGRRWLAVAAAVVWVGCLAAAAHSRTGIYRTELDAWRDTVRKAPGNPRAHENLAVCAGKDGQVQEAIRHYRTALTIKPNTAKYHQNLSECLVSTAPELAMRHAARAVALAPTDRLLQNNLAVVLHACGREEEAIAAAEDTIQLDPRWEVGYITLGNLLKDRSPADAIGHLRQAVALNPASADAYNSLGILLAFANDPEAAACFEAALAHDPNHAESWLNLATCHVARGRDAEARACLRRAIQLRPGWPQAVQNLRALESRLMMPEPAATAP